MRMKRWKDKFTVESLQEGTREFHRGERILRNGKKSYE